MPALTARQISAGKGGKPIVAPDQATVGRWACCLCPAAGRGTLADARLHYRTHHQQPPQETPHAVVPDR